MSKITLNEIEVLDRSMLTPEDIAPYLECDSTMIREQAQLDPSKLGFPVIVIKENVIIPKAGFVYFCKYGRPNISSEKERAECKIEKSRISVREAATILGRGKPAIEKALREGTFPVGTCLINSKGQFAYIIPREGFERFLRGDIAGRKFQED